MISIKQLITRETSVTLIINLLLGSGGTYLSLKQNDIISLIEGDKSLGFSMLALSILFPIIGTLITTAVIRKKVLTGILQPFTKQELRWLPKNTLLTSICLALICSMLFLPIALGLFWLGFGESMPLATCMTLYTVYLIVITVLLNPVMVYRAVHL